MAKKELQKILNELISESERKKPNRNLDRILSLDIPVVKRSDELFSINLNEIIIFDGVENIVSKLLDEVRESCFFGQSDVSVNFNVEKDSCPQFYEAGIHKIFFYSLIENLEQLPVLYKSMVNHLRYIFNALQSPGINKGLFAPNAIAEQPMSLLFPFNREVDDDETGLHYLIERVPGSHFLRITAEELDHSRLNLRRINHRIVSNIELIENFFDLRQNAFVIHSSMINRCYDNRMSYKDSGLQLAELLGFLKATGYATLREITVNWPRAVANELLSGNTQPWYDVIIRMLLILSDSTTLELLSSEKTIEVSFCDSKSFITLTQRGRNLQIDLQEKMLVSGLNEYLLKMERLHKTVEDSACFPDACHVIFIHHFTAETLAVLGAFDKMQIHTVDTLWVKYSGSVPSKYLETILSLPESVYRFYGLQQVSGRHTKTKFCLSDRYSSIDELTGLQWWLDMGEFEFFPAMQRVAMHLFLNAITNGENTRIVIAEDGGYLAPLVNRLALEKHTVGEVFEQFGYENGLLQEKLKVLEFGEWISPLYCGSVEHTRNGYDALKEVENTFSKLAFPACSLAISNYKVNDESVEVAYSCLNAIENILGGQGFVLSSRNALVLGSLGAIGIQTMNILSHRLGKNNLAGVDIRTDETQNYLWKQVATPSEIDAEILKSIDLIFGVVGRSILDVSFFEELILHTQRNTIFLASGSTKRFEFIDFLDWTEKLLASQNPMVGKFPVIVTSSIVEDPQTSSLQGTVVSFNLVIEGRNKRVDFYVLSNGMPVNFQYYGVARETMDLVMTEFVSLVNVISQAKEKQLPAKVLALDHDINLNGEIL